jgi:hypothetical protein
VTGIPAHQLPLRFGLVRGIPLFILGMLIARLPTTIAPKLADGLALAAGVGVVALQVVGHFDHASLALLGLLIYAAGASGAKGWGWASLAGRLSFSLFLTNQLVAVVWFGLLRAVAGPSWVSTDRCCGRLGHGPARLRRRRLAVRALRRRAAAGLDQGLVARPKAELWRPDFTCHPGNGAAVIRDRHGTPCLRSVRIGGLRLVAG